MARRATFLLFVVSTAACSPAAMEAVRAAYGDREDLALCDRPYAALTGADALAIVTEWREFRSPDFAAIKSALREPVIFDGRNLYDPVLLGSQGFRYFSIGRGVSLPAELQSRSARTG